MYTLIGDMYREPFVVVPVPTDPTAPPIWPQPTATQGQSEDCYSSDYNGIYIAYPATWLGGTGHLLGRIDRTRSIKLQGIIFERLLAPEDTESLPERLQFNATNVTPILLENLDSLFQLNYGKLFSIRSHPDERIYFGMIVGWNIADGVSNRVDPLGCDYTSDRSSLTIDFISVVSEPIITVIKPVIDFP